MQDWRNGLFSFDDKGGICIKTFLCPHCVAAQALTDYNGSDCIFNLLCMSCNVPAIRNAMRSGYQIEGNCLMDFLCGSYCPLCVICQSAKEAEIRGAIQPLTGRTQQVEWESDWFQLDMDCVYAWFCPCCAAASARSNFDGSDWCFNCACVYPLFHLSIIRNGYNIAGSCIGDMCWMYWCQPCIIARMKREVEKRGMSVAKNVAGAPGSVYMQ